MDRQLAAARASLAAAGRHDRAGWLALFSRDGRVEDPVGSAPHIGREQLGRFYDTFIGPREITFEPRADFVGRATVVRDLTLNVRMSPARFSPMNSPTTMASSKLVRCKHIGSSHR